MVNFCSHNIRVWYRNWLLSIVTYMYANFKHQFITFSTTKLFHIMTLCLHKYTMIYVFSRLTIDTLTNYCQSALLSLSQLFPWSSATVESKHSKDNKKWSFWSWIKNKRKNRKGNNGKVLISVTIAFFSFSISVANYPVKRLACSFLLNFRLPFTSLLFSFSEYFTDSPLITLMCVG